MKSKWKHQNLRAAVGFGVGDGVGTTTGVGVAAQWRNAQPEHQYQSVMKSKI